MAAQELADPLITTFNQCVTEKTWPNIWKKGEWIPVFKKEDPLVKTNYRPITVLTVFKTISDHFMSAYRKMYSSERTLVRLIEDWKHALDPGKSVGVPLTDKK